MEQSAIATEDFTKRLINKINLAPMVRINTLPFRLLSKNYGADFIFTEEIIDRKFQHTIRLLNKELNTIDYVSTRDYSLVIRLKQSEKPQLILQIGTNQLETALMAVERTQQDISGVDVNMGCPKKFSVHGGMGSALMKDKENAQRIMKGLVDKFGKIMSVSCKIRVLDTFEETLDYVLAMQETGIHWISIHSRTAAEESKVPAKWYIVKQLLETGKIKIPVLGSGDMLTSYDCAKFIRFTGAQGVIIARGAIHNPKIFMDKQLMINPPKELGLDERNDWVEHIAPKQVSEQQKEEQKIEDKSKSNKKKANEDEESIEFSQNLVRMFEQRYQLMQQTPDVLPIVKEYFKICLETGNHFQNTKYCILYIMKTHKNYYEMFKKLQVARDYLQYAKILDMEEFFNSISDEIKAHFDGQFYRKHKHIIDNQIKDQQEIQTIGVKRPSEESIRDLESESKRIKTD